MIVADLSPGDLAHRLAGDGLRLRTGPLLNCIRSTLDRVVQGIARHYGDYQVDESGTFADFQVRVAHPPSLRRWFKPQAIFQCDAARPFKPLPGDQAFPMLEWGLNWCVSSHCHQYLIVHAAVVEKSWCSTGVTGTARIGQEHPVRRIGHARLATPLRRAHAVRNAERVTSSRCLDPSVLKMHPSR